MTSHIDAYISSRDYPDCPIWFRLNEVSYTIPDAI